MPHRYEPCKMIKLTLSILVVILASCSSNHPEIDEFERDRQNLIKNDIGYAASFDVDSLGNKKIRLEAYYTKEGYMTQMRFYQDNGKLDFIETYAYNQKGFISETKRGNSLDSLKTVNRKEWDVEKNLEIDFFYKENGHVYKSIYQNDSLDRNIHKEHYLDSVLISTFSYQWSGKHMLCKIQGFDPDGNETSSLKQEFDDGKLISSIRYNYDQLEEKTSITYNSNGLKERIIIEKPNDYIYTTSIKYENGLAKEEVNEYKSLSDDYSNIQLTVWEYKKHGF